MKFFTVYLHRCVYTVYKAVHSPLRCFHLYMTTPMLPSTNKSEGVRSSIFDTTPLSLILLLLIHVIIIGMEFGQQS